ncbi:creatininase family protein [Zavarzinia sp. CC-PAN008]|uniref:creatininase family protein n=1 Tax=Zavarzinia sp. CC-PAN008 TaxID=3243332 RepID=UPI003F7424EE
MMLQLATWPDVEAYLRTRRGVIVPIGSTEQHGPNGMIGTDAICPETIARGVSERGGVLVAPTLPIGMAQHHMSFPGSITLRPSTLIALVQDVLTSLARHGFTRFYFLNGHGGNVATLTAAFSEFYAGHSLAGGHGANDGTPARCRLRNWWTHPGVGRIAREAFGGREGSHATPSEISLTWHAHPQAARPMKFPESLPPEQGFTDAADYRRRHPDGRMGSDPGLASVEHGTRLYESAVTETLADFERFEGEA